MRFFSLLCAAALGWTAAPAQPRIEIAGGDSLSLGSISRGSVIERTLTIKNTGKGELVLHDVDASCGCTGTVLSSKTIPGGGTGSLRVTFNSKNFVGPVHKSVTIRSNASNSPVHLIRFTATVTQEIMLSPQHFWFKDAEVGRTESAEITVRNEGKEDLRLSGYRCALKGFVLQLPAAPISPGTEARLKATFTAAQTTPVIADAVFVDTSNPRMAELYIPIFGNAKEFRFE